MNKYSLVHIAIDRNHLSMCGECCTCSDPKLKFRDEQSGLPEVTCSKCLEFSTLSVKELMNRLEWKDSGNGKDQD